MRGPREWRTPQSGSRQAVWKSMLVQNGYARGYAHYIYIYTFVHISARVCARVCASYIYVFSRKLTLQRAWYARGYARYIYIGFCTQFLHQARGHMNVANVQENHGMLDFSLCIVGKTIEKGRRAADYQRGRSSTACVKYS